MFENKVITPAAVASSQQDHDAVALFERAKLSPVQKAVLIVATVVILALVGGVGIWLNSFLPQLRVDSQNTLPNSIVNTTKKDTDQDGLTDVDEQQKYHTNPNIKDTDGDGYNDGEEIKNSYNPNGPGKL